MKKFITLLVAAILVCALTATAFVGCANVSEADGIHSEWAANWGAFSPVSAMPPVPTPTPEPLPETGVGGSTGVEEIPQTVAPAVKYSSMILSDTQGLNIRSAPSTSASVVGSMDKGDMLRYEGTCNGWYKTVYKQKVAYVNAGSKYAHIVQMKQSPESKIEKIIAVGEELLGYPYVWGSQRYHWGNGVLNTNFVQGEYDCSALMQYIFYKGGGILLDLNTRTQVLQGKTVASGDLQRGDVIFFTNASRCNNKGIERVGHVALYLGNNYILHTASDHAVIEEISPTRWGYYIIAKRFV